MATMGPTRQRYSERWAGNVLRLARAQRGWTQRQLAEAAGVPQSTIGRIESGAMQPTWLLLDRILVGADLELRTRLEPYESHDDVLDATDATRTPEQRAAADRAQRELTGALRDSIATLSRPRVCDCGPCTTQLCSSARSASRSRRGKVGWSLTTAPNTCCRPAAPSATVLDAP